MHSDQTELTVAINRLLDVMNRLDRSGNTAQISVNAGGMGMTGLAAVQEELAQAGIDADAIFEAARSMAGSRQKAGAGSR